MTTVKKGLGRGLSALIPDADMDALSEMTREGALFSGNVSPGPIRKASKSSGAQPPMQETYSAEKTKTSRSRQTPDEITSTSSSLSMEPTATLRIKDISPNPFQPRRTFDEEELQDLAASIRLHGILQPILVRPTMENDSTFQLVAGERRWRAAQVAGLHTIPVIIRPMADQQALELALIENVQRHDISGIDAALAYQRLASEFKLSQEQISRRVGKSRSAVANTMRLLSLPTEARKAIEEGTLSEGHGRAILLAAGEGARRAIFRRVVCDKLSVRDVERLARDSSHTEDKQGKDKNASDASRVVPSDDWLEAERELTRKLGTVVKIRATSHRSHITIECGDSSEMRRVLALLQRTA